MDKFSIVSLGCPKNLVDSEYIAQKMENCGFRMADEGRYVIVNTCAFIAEAVRESVETILRLAQKGNKKKIIVTGCMVERYGESLQSLLPEVDLFVGRSFYPVFEEIVEKRGFFSSGLPFHETFPRKPLTKPPVAYLKIQEGCDNMCTYCTIPSIRGRLRCRKPEEILRELKWLLDSGFKEINVIGQDITAYGKDLGMSLKDLILEMLKIPGDYHIRLLYLNPKGITEDLIDLVANEERIVKYLDIPIQHCENRVLSLMGRNYTKEYLEGLLETIKKRIPEVTLRTTVMVGFPSERDEEFEALLNFVEKWGFNMLGAFMYSPEEGTEAAKMKGQLTKRIKSERFNKIMETQKTISRKKLAQLVGKKSKVIVEEEGKPYLVGRILEQAPDVDGIAFIKGKAKKGEIKECRILKSFDYDVLVEI